MKNLKPIILLVASATILPELLTGSTPLPAFFLPSTLGILLVWYGVLVLLTRELSVRMGLGIKGLFWLGFGYAIFNEGFVAKTMVMKETLPIVQYTGYGVLGGISIPWSLAISLWHAVSSVVFPILLTYYLFPDAKDKPWIGKKTGLIIGLGIAMISFLAFRSEYRIQGTTGQLLAFIVAVIIWLFIGLRSKSAIATGRASWKVFWWGVSAMVYFHIVLSGIAGSKLNPLIFYIALFGGIWFYAWVLCRNDCFNVSGILVFISGSYVVTALLGVVLAVIFPIGFGVVRVISGLAGIYLMFKIAKRAISIPAVESVDKSAF